jgi:hypothetical protein
MSVLLRLWACVAVLGSCGVAFAGNFFDDFSCPSYFSANPFRGFAGIYEHSTAETYVRLQVGEGGIAELYEGADDHGRGVDRSGGSYIIDGAPQGTSLAGGVILVAGWNTAENWPKDELAFEGFSSHSGEPVTRRYKLVHKGESLEILDISDPSSPITLRPQKSEGPFPWTTTAVVASLIVGSLAGRHYGMRSKKSHFATQSSQGPATTSAGNASHEK